MKRLIDFVMGGRKRCKSYKDHTFTLLHQFEIHSELIGEYRCKRCDYTFTKTIVEKEALFI